MHVAEKIMDDMIAVLKVAYRNWDDRVYKNRIRAFQSTPQSAEVFPFINITVAEDSPMENGKSTGANGLAVFYELILKIEIWEQFISSYTVQRPGEVITGNITKNADYLRQWLERKRSDYCDYDSYMLTTERPETVDGSEHQSKYSLRILPIQWLVQYRVTRGDPETAI